MNPRPRLAGPASATTTYVDQNAGFVPRASNLPETALVANGADSGDTARTSAIRRVPSILEPARRASAVDDKRTSRGAASDRSRHARSSSRASATRASRPVAPTRREPQTGPLAKAQRITLRASTTTLPFAWQSGAADLPAMAVTADATAASRNWRRAGREGSWARLLL